MQNFLWNWRILWKKVWGTKLAPEISWLSQSLEINWKLSIKKCLINSHWKAYLIKRELIILFVNRTEIAKKPVKYQNNSFVHFFLLKVFLILKEESIKIEFHSNGFLTYFDYFKNYRRFFFRLARKNCIFVTVDAFSNMNDSANRIVHRDNKINHFVIIRCLTHPAGLNFFQLLHTEPREWQKSPWQ